MCACLTSRKRSLLVYQWLLTLVHIRNFEGVFIQYWGLRLIPRYSDFSGLELGPNISTFLKSSPGEFRMQPSWESLSWERAGVKPALVEEEAKQGPWRRNEQGRRRDSSPRAPIGLETNSGGGLVSSELWKPKPLQGNEMNCLPTPVPEQRQEWVQWT